jgi:two-component system response regulator DesR
MPSDRLIGGAGYTGPGVGIACADHTALLSYGATLTRAGLVVAALAHSIVELALEASDARIDVAVLNTDQPQARLSKDVADVRSRLPHARVLVVTRAATGRQLRHALDAGVDGLILARQARRALPEAVRAVHAGLFCAPPELRGQTVAPNLSPREAELVALAGGGLANTEIAARLALSESTVKSHLSSAFAKLGVSSRREAAARLADNPGSDESPTS